MKIRTRFAPSPTGKLHIGGARTALFCHLYAKHHNGEFILRLEDTDIEREIAGGEQNLITGLKWLGIEPDFYPGKELQELGKFRQSEKLDIYLSHANKLLEQGHAYKCFCKYDSEQMATETNSACGTVLYDKDGKPFKTQRKCLNNQNQSSDFSIRMKMPDDEVFSWNDGVRGTVTFNSKDIGDWVAIKSNKIATYNFANPIDDTDMKITHVFRGEEHISNTPKQLQIYKLLNLPLPHFTHLTVITGNDGKKLSKRDEKVLQFVDLYEQRGYIPQAVVNFLALLGWSPKNEDEIFTLIELEKMFTIEGLSKASSRFDLDKLKWMNNLYMKKFSKEELLNFLQPFLAQTKLPKNIVEEICLLYQPSLREGSEIVEHLKLFEDHQLNYTPEQLQIISTKKDLFKIFSNNIKSIDVWNQENVLNAIKNSGETTSFKGKDLMMPIRILLTGVEHGPDLSKTIELFGKQKTIKIIEEYLNV